MNKISIRQQITIGTKAFWQGQRMIWLKHRNLLRYCMMPMGLGLLVLVASLWLFGAYHDELLHWIWQKPKGWLLALWTVFWAVGFVVLLGTAVLLSFLAFMI